MLNTSTATYINDTATLKRILLQLIQNENLRYTQLSTTNIFVLLNRPNIANDNSNLIELRDFKLNRSCKKFRISFRDSSDDQAFEIFQDDFNEMLNLNEENNQKNTSIKEEKINDDKEKEEEEEVKLVWYQSKLFVKGFNDVKNNSIWT